MSLYELKKHDLPSKSFAYLPLDIPKIENKNSIIKNFLHDSNRSNYVWWNMLILYGQRQYHRHLDEASNNWNIETFEKYPEITAAISFLPFEQIYYLHLAQSCHNIPPHVDEIHPTRQFDHHMTISPKFKKHLYKNEPIGYRFLISGCRSSFYLSRHYDKSYSMKNFTTSKIFCTLPHQTDFFLIRNSLIPHGVDNIENFSGPRISGFILGKVNEKKHHQLIKRSHLKFHDNVKYFSNIIN